MFDYVTASRMNQLRSILSESIEAYELAKISRSRSSQIAEAEEARASDLVALADNVERRSRQLLEKAGLAHISGAPLAIEANPEWVRDDSDQKIADAFAAAQTAVSDLRVELLQLASALLEVNRLDEAIQVASAVSDESTEATVNTAADLIVQAQARQLNSQIREADITAVGKWQNWLIENGEHREVEPLCEELVGLASQLNSNDRPRDALVLYELVTSVPGWQTSEIEERRKNSIRTILGAAVDAHDDETLVQYRDWIETHGERHGLLDAVRMLHDRLLRDAIKTGDHATARQQLDRVKAVGNVSVAARNLIFQEPELTADYLGVKWIFSEPSLKVDGIAVSPALSYVATLTSGDVSCYEIHDEGLLSLHEIAHKSHYRYSSLQPDSIHFYFSSNDSFVGKFGKEWESFQIDPIKGTLRVTRRRNSSTQTKRQKLFNVLAPYCTVAIRGADLEILSYAYKCKLRLSPGSRIKDIDVADDARYLFLACREEIKVLDLGAITQTESADG